MKGIIGIDPGATGAIALLGDDVRVWDMPSNPRDLYEILRELTFATAMVEQAQSMPGQGVSSMFKYGVGYGQILGVLAGLAIPYMTVTPAVWKRKMSVTKDKEATRALARQLWPTAELSRKKDHGRAEALLIAEYARRHANIVEIGAAR